MSLSRLPCPISRLTKLFSIIIDNQKLIKSNYDCLCYLSAVESSSSLCPGCHVIFMCSMTLLCFSESFHQTAASLYTIFFISPRSKSAKNSLKILLKYNVMCHCKDAFLILLLLLLTQSYKSVLTAI